MKLRRIPARAKTLLRDAVDRTGLTARGFRARLAAATGAPGEERHVLVAPPGAGNIGDQAMVEAFVAAADRPVTVITRHPDDFALPEDLAPRATLTALPDLFYGQGAAHAADVARLGGILGGSATVSIIGADIMDGVYTLRPSLRRAALAAAAASAGFATSVIGFSWNGSAPKPAWEALRAAGDAGARLLLRDPASAARVREAGIAGVIDTADIVFTDDRLAELPAALAAIPEPYALLNASGLIARSVDQAPEYAAVIDDLRARGIHVVLLPHVIRATADDLAACRAVAAAVGAEGVTLVEQQLAPSVIRRLADRATIVVTGRMHLAVMSLSRGVPAITLASQGKVEGLMRLFAWPELCVAPRAGMASGILAVVDAALADEATPARVADGARRARELARANIAHVAAERAAT